MGEVILGMPGPWGENYCELADHYTTKIGGLPDWPVEVSIRPDLLECRVCGSSMCLVIQLYAPISHASLTIEERILYIFGCVNPKCAHDPLSWRAIRLQKSPNEEESKAPIQEVSPSAASAGPISKSSYLDLSQNDSDEEDLDDVDLEELGLLLSEASSQASNSKKQNGHQQKRNHQPPESVRKIRLAEADMPVIPCFYIYSQKESSSGGVGSVGTSLASLNLTDNRNEDQNEEETWEEEGYEYDRALHVDRTYLKFMKRMNAFPEQCFRYSYGGKPLLATRELEKPGKCVICDGPQHYEMQLMPPLLFFLREACDSSTQYTEDWNWMTLITYTCSKSCSSQHDGKKSSRNDWTVAEEYVVLQFEEPLQLSSGAGYLSK
ncbi:hypothetical protein C5167_014131 [Papaver somniferum]|uniref:Programmed cell death protein 2 C-terminal domain-containing protein n=1 Tax=Papaver somniferum TaxID=3469 RepID=A0A4Y7J387_PAPSO|nr:probable 20S rRNA accumulation protein 4 [Papaver somniferum]RZC55277.1 hypothetical protein C5167_014131 [Papaver somniferum]